MLHVLVIMVEVRAAKLKVTVGVDHRDYRCCKSAAQGARASSTLNGRGPE